MGERIVGLGLGALACAICVTFTAELLKGIWYWLLLIVVFAGAVAVSRWRIRRW